ncbi:MAG: CHAT domain-containing protein [bacterium]
MRLTKSLKRIVLATVVGGLLLSTAFIWWTTSNDFDMSSVSLDDLKVYRLNNQKYATLAEWHVLRKQEAESFQTWVRDHYWPLQNIGLRLAEQGTILAAQGVTEAADAKLDTALDIGSTLIEAVDDSFLIQLVQNIKRLDGGHLKHRARASIAYAQSKEEFNAGDYQTARQHFERARKLAHKADDDKLLVDVLIVLQWLTIYDAGQNRRGVELGEELIEKAENVGYKRRLAEALLQTANAQSVLGEAQAASQRLEMATNISRSIGYLQVVAGSYYSLAHKFYFNGDFESSERALQKLTEIDEEKLYLGVAWLLQGKIHLDRGEYDKAKEHFYSALEFFRHAGHTHNEAAVLENLAILENTIGEYESALNRAKEGLQVLPKEESSSSLLKILGQVYSNMDSIDTAIATYEQALEVAQFQDSEYPLAILLLSIGDTHLRKQNLAQAGIVFSEADSLAQRLGMQHIQIAAQIGIGRTKLDSLPADAGQFFGRALKLARSIDEPDLLVEALYWLSVSEQDLSHHQDAYAYIQEAIETIEKVRKGISVDTLKVSFFATTQEVFDQAVLLSYLLDKRNEALWYSDLAKARALRDAWHTTAGNYVEQEAWAASSLAHFESLLSTLPENAQVMAYRVTAEELFIWLINADAVTSTQRAIHADSLSGGIDRFLKSLGATDQRRLQERFESNAQEVYAENHRLGRQLYEVIVQPIEAMLDPGKKVYIVPDAALHKVPFGALVDGKGNFFDQKYIWAKAPSLSTLCENQRLQIADGLPKQKQFLMVGGDFASFSSEKRLITKHFQNLTILERESASYDSLRKHLQNGGSTVYLSVHAIADEQNPMNSHLQLNQSLPANGHYMPVPIYARRLLQLGFPQTELVVLNACETAKGKIALGEGPLNMVRIFSLQQVPTVVATLWKNADDYSSIFIRQFFTLIANNESPMVATHLAKRHLIAQLTKEIDYPIPYFWSVFEVHNNGFEQINLLELSRLGG